MVTKEWLARIHERLLENDPVAPAELAEAILQPLVNKLRKRYPQIPDRDLVDDAATDALIDYLKRPSRFNPDKLSLFGFLLMAADRNIRNTLAKLRRRKKREFSVEHVEHVTAAGNRRVAAKVNGYLLSEEIRKEASKFLNKKERQVFELMADGVRSTSEYAKVLGIKDRPARDQRREVKRWKDKIKKRLQRQGILST